MNNDMDLSCCLPRDKDIFLNEYASEQFNYNSSDTPSNNGMRANDFITGMILSNLLDQVVMPFDNGNTLYYRIRENTKTHTKRLQLIGLTIKDKSNKTIGSYYYEQNVTYKSQSGGKIGKVSSFLLNKLTSASIIVDISAQHVAGTACDKSLQLAIPSVQNTLRTNFGDIKKIGSVMIGPWFNSANNKVNCIKDKFSGSGIDLTFCASKEEEVVLNQKIKNMVSLVI